MPTKRYMGSWELFLWVALGVCLAIVLIWMGVVLWKAVM